MGAEGELTLVAVTAIIDGPDKLRARVEYEQRRELWPVSRDDARNIVRQFTGEVEAKSLVPGGEEVLTLTREPVLVELPKPPSDEIEFAVVGT